MISASHVTKSYASSTRPALSDVSVEIATGEFAFLIGASGSGKSTFLRLVLREDRIDSGKLVVAGHDLTRMKTSSVPALRRTLGCVFQDFRLLQGKTVAENVAFALQVIGKSRRTIDKVVPETLEMVGLGREAGRRPHELSGGEQQRVAIARAFVNRPQLLLADEPTGNLDAATGHEIVDLLFARRAETGATLLVITHDPELAEQCGRIITLADGRIATDTKADTGEAAARG